MEHGGRLIPSHQGRLTFRSLGKVAYIVYNGQLMALLALFGEAAHPCTASLGRTTEIVAIEEGKRLAILVGNLKYLHVWVIGWDVLALLKVESIYTMGSVEHAVHLDAVDIEVRLHLVVGDVEHLLLHLG